MKRYALTLLALGMGGASAVNPHLLWLIVPSFAAGYLAGRWGR